MRCDKAAIELNMRRIVDYLKEADTYAVDLVGFPEMSLTGYADPTQYPEAVLALDGPEIGRFLELTGHCSAKVLVGLIEKNPAGKPFITQILTQRGELLGYYRKITIQAEEVEWFSPGPGSVLVFESGGSTLGLAICADIHTEAVFAECQRQGAELVMELAAPGLYGEQASRNWQSGYAWWEGECQKWLGQYARQYGLWICVATQAGRTVDEDFPGGGYIFGPTGQRLYSTADWAAGAVYVGLDMQSGQVVELGATRAAA
jgi:predicted amidohydrolase